MKDRWESSNIVKSCQVKNPGPMGTTWHNPAAVADVIDLAQQLLALVRHGSMAQ